MTSRSGRSAAVLARILLLLLFSFSAGIGLVACGDDEEPAPAPAPTPTPTPPPPEPEPEPEGLAAPENLRVTATTANSLTWSWNAVEGAAGYQVQLSTDVTFDGSDAVFFKAANQTSHQAANLAGSTAYYVRVRAFTGTLTDPEAGEWTAASMGMTSVAPTPTPTALEAPDNFGSEGRDNDSISLAWDEVDGAGSYEVEQREEGGSWAEASCGGGDNAVTGTTCVASDLDSGTEYDFRVRALPEDEDENTTSEWTVTSSAISTTGIATTPPPATSGGAGDLNLTWDSDEGTVTWYWDLVDRTTTYEIQGPTVAEDMAVEASPCTGGTWTAQTGAGSNRQTQTVTAGHVALLCVRPVAKEGQPAAAPSWAYATVPGGLTGANEISANFRTTAINFVNVVLDPGFTYDVRKVATTVADTGFAAKDCDGGETVRMETTDIALPIAAYRVTGLSPYTRYGLCYRAVNDAGMSQWEVSGDDETVTTRPAAPPSPTATRTTIGVNDSLEMEWLVATRGNAGLPRRYTGNYEVSVLSMNTVNPRTTPGDTSTPLIPDIALKHCPDGERTNYSPATPSPDPVDTQDGFRITHTASRNSFDPANNLDKDYRVCVRARTPGTSGDTGAGPWSIGSRILVKEAAGS